MGEALLRNPEVHRRRRHRHGGSTLVAEQFTTNIISGTDAVWWFVRDGDDVQNCVTTSISITTTARRICTAVRAG
jgi:hypothetical protein